MIKELTIFILTVFSLIHWSVTGQKSTIEADPFPLYQFIEWKGAGAFLLGRNPNGNENKVFLKILNDQPSTYLKKGFNPNGKSFYFISAENTRHSYFFDDFKMDNGKLSIHQINLTGDVKSVVINLSTSLKNLDRFDPNNLEMVDIVTTNDALVIHFRYKDNKTKSILDIASFITHHNLLIYSVIIGETSELTLKDPSYTCLNYIGFSSGTILFAARDKQDKKSGWSIKTFSPKGEFLQTSFLSDPDKTFENFTQSYTGCRGATYLKSSGNEIPTKLSYQNGQFKLVGIHILPAGKTLSYFHWTDKSWKEIGSFVLPAELSKKSVSLADFGIQEGMICKVLTSLIFIPDPTMAPQLSQITSTYSEGFINNPSNLLVKSKPLNAFAVYLKKNDILIENSELNKPGTINVEWRNH